MSGGMGKQQDRLQKQAFHRDLSETIIPGCITTPTEGFQNSTNIRRI